MTPEEFRSKIASGEIVVGQKQEPTTKKKRRLPSASDEAAKMREIITRYCLKYPKLTWHFSNQNIHYKVARKYMSGEDLFQMLVNVYVLEYLPEVTFIHPKNESKTRRVESAKKRLFGVMPGACDCLLIHGDAETQNLWIELKVGKNKPTEKQLSFIDNMNKSGDLAFWSNDVDDVIDTINEWNNNKINSNEL